MALSADDAVRVAAHLRKVLDAERQNRLDRIHGYLRGKRHRIYVPRSATHEYRELVEQAKVNILPLVVTEIAQNLFVEGYRPARKAENAAVWKIWQANRMDARQSGIYRATLGYGLAYATVLPGQPTPVIRPYSPRKFVAVYDDPEADEWPRFGLAVSPGSALDDGGRVREVARLRLLDDTNVYHFEAPPHGGLPRLVEIATHGLGVCPVVRWLNESGDVDDGSQGEVEPLIPLQDQLDNTTFGLLMAQQYAAFKQRWVTGMAIAEDETGNPVEPLNAAVNRLWQAESPDARFGEFSETNLGGYLGSRESTLRLISSMAQIPPHAIASSGAIANLSAEALAAIEAGLQRKVADRKTGFGESVEQMLRLAGLAAGDQAAWRDIEAQVVWRDTESRSLAQIADALGKMAQMLQIPPRALWERIPGVTDQDLQRWEELAREADAMGRLEQLMNREVEDAEPGRASADTAASG